MQTWPILPWAGTMPEAALSNMIVRLHTESKALSHRKAVIQNISHRQGMTGKKGGLLLIEVSVRKNQIKVKGHAGLTKKGEDIICAAVSILAQNLVNSIQNLTQDKITCVIESGKVIINLDFENLSEQTKTLIDSFFLGICSIANEFPNNVKVM